ncbi:MAG: MoaD/ThiS family protein [Pseudohongiellaceae bacterium]
MIRVIIPSQLESYTSGAREVTLDLPPDRPLTLLDAMDALEARFPGIRFRIIDEQSNIRRNIAIFVGESMVRALDEPLRQDDRVQIVGALSGG